MSAPPIIILAEPDPIISSVLRVEFSELDFAVLMATTAGDAEEYAAHAVASLVVLDVGLAAAGRVHRLRPHPAASAATPAGRSC